MGYLPSPTPDMGKVSIETRSRSFYMHLGYIGAIANGDGRDGNPLMIEIDYSDADQVLAAIEQAKRLHLQGNEYEWVDENGDPVPPIQRAEVMPIEWLDLDAAQRIEIARAFPMLQDTVMSVITADQPAIKDIEILYAKATGSTDVTLDPMLYARLGDALAAAQTDYERRLREARIPGAPPEKDSWDD